MRAAAVRIRSALTEAITRIGASSPAISSCASATSVFSASSAASCTVSVAPSPFLFDKNGRASKNGPFAARRNVSPDSPRKISNSIARSVSCRRARSILPCFKTDSPSRTAKAKRPFSRCSCAVCTYKSVTSRIIPFFIKIAARNVPSSSTGWA